MSIKQSDKPMPFSKISYENIQDYLRWIVPGFVTLFLSFDILPKSFRETEILLPSGIILSIFIYAIAHLISHTQHEKIYTQWNSKEFFKWIVKFSFMWVVKFFTVGRSYEKHIKDVTEKFKVDTMENTEEKEKYNERQLLELYKICQDKKLPEHHESAHRYTSFYWLFSCSALAAVLSILLRIFIRYYNSFSNCPLLWPLDWKSFSPFEKFFYPTDILIIAVNFVIIIIFRWFAKEFAKRITEVDEVIIDIIKKQVYLEY